MLIDTHLHLDAAEFDPDRDEVLDGCRTVGISGFVVPSVDRDSFTRVAMLADGNPDIHPAFGIHPLFVDAAVEVDIALLEARLQSGRCVAVGEIGLDHYVTDVDRDRQQHFFLAQLRLAQRFELPVILHLRRAQDEVLKQLRRIRVCGGIAHAFNGSRQQADAFISLGFKLGFGGAMTFEGSQRIRRLATELPLEAIVLETDAPDMAPAWGQGKRNEPANVVRYAQVLADLRGITVDEVITATGRNAVAALPAIAQ
ncbi:MAG: DNAase [Betaproteobacteria bacterium HGW-Betaproteobacteria-21]|nr:MAG: DNAase [Betaproteobacteria bacterium HGW-Betaproteobacteria-21]